MLLSHSSRLLAYWMGSLTFRMGLLPSVRSLEHTHVNTYLNQPKQIVNRGSSPLPTEYVISSGRDIYYCPSVYPCVPQAVSSCTLEVLRFHLQHPLRRVSKNIVQWNQPACGNHTESRNDKLKGNCRQSFTSQVCPVDCGSAWEH